MSCKNKDFGDKNDILSMSFRCHNQLEIISKSHLVLGGIVITKGS
jgi:hypothetical protein